MPRRGVRPSFSALVAGYSVLNAVATAIDTLIWGLPGLIATGLGGLPAARHAPRHCAPARVGSTISARSTTVALSPRKSSARQSSAQRSPGQSSSSAADQ